MYSIIWICILLENTVSPSMTLMRLCGCIVLSESAPCLKILFHHQWPWWGCVDVQYYLNLHLPWKYCFTINDLDDVVWMYSIIWICTFVKYYLNLHLAWKYFFTINDPDEVVWMYSIIWICIFLENTVSPSMTLMRLCGCIVLSESAPSLKILFHHQWPWWGCVDV